MRILIVYYSFTGNNKALAEKLQHLLHADILRIEEERKRTNFSIFLDMIFRRKPKLKKYNFLPFAYDHLILIAPVWAGKVSTPMQRFLELEKGVIKKYSFISLCGGIAGQREKLEDHLFTTTRRKPELVAELWLSKLPSSDSKKQLNYRVKGHDWKTFDADIDRFVADINPEVAERIGT